MKRLAAVVILLLLPACAAEAGEAGEASSQSEEGRAEMTLEGAWEMVHLKTPDGPDETFKGHLIVSGNYVCHLRVEKEREPFGDEEGDERAAKAGQLFRQQAAACGSFSREGATLTVNWLTSTSPNTEGNASEFILEIQRDQLSLSPAATEGEFAFVYRRPAN